MNRLCHTTFSASLFLLATNAALAQEASDPAAEPAVQPADRSDDAPCGDVCVRADAGALARYDVCLSEVARGNEGDALACFERLSADAPGTEAALRAEISLLTLRRLALAPASPAVPVDQPGFNIPAGRLGLTATTGLFGVWNAIAFGAMASATFHPQDARPLVVATGVGALALGVGMGAGGYLLADRLDLNEGAARLVASGLLWGTAFGVGLAPSVATRIPPTAGAAVFTNATIGTVLAAGYIGGGGALLAATQLSFDEAQVGLINSGGMLGGTLGILTSISIASLANPTAPLPIEAFTLPPLGGMALGIAAAGVAGRFVDLTWGEVLLADLGGVIGVVAGGATGIVIASSGGHPIGFTIPTAVGASLGYGGALTGAILWRQARGAPLVRGAPGFRPTVGMSSFGDSVVPTIGLKGSL